MKFKVTGGQDGVSGVEVAGKRYEPGDEVEMTEAKAAWLVEAGYLIPADPRKAAKYVPVEPEPEPEPIVEAQEESEEPTSEGEVF